MLWRRLIDLLLTGCLCLHRSHLPKAMQETVHGYLYSTFDILKIFDSFDSVNLSRHNREAIGDLCGKMRPLVITPTDNGAPATIYEDGDSAGELYFIIKGVVHVTTVLEESEHGMEAAKRLRSHSCKLFTVAICRCVWFVVGSGL